MITKKKIEIYKYYDGDVDSFSYASKSHKRMILEEDFFLITRFIQDLVIIKNGLAAREFQDEVEKSLKHNCDDQKTIDFLKLLAEERAGSGNVSK